MNLRHDAPITIACQASLLGSLLVWLPAFAQNSLTIPMEVARISNPDLAPLSPGSVTVYRLSPQYTLLMIQGSSRTELSLGGTIERTSNTNLTPNRTLPRLGVLWETSSAVSVVGLRASLEDASTRETEFAEFGRVTRDSTQRTGTIEARWTRDLSDGSSLEAVTSLVSVSYDTPLTVDYRETLGNVTYRFDSTDRTRYSLTASAGRLNPNGMGQNSSRRGLGLGYEVDISEGFNLNMTVGAVWTSAPLSRTSSVGSLSLGYEGERTVYAMSWSRIVSARGSLAGYARSETLDASLTYPINVNTSLSLGAIHARSLEADRDAGTTAFIRVRSGLTKFWAWTLGLEHRRYTPSGRPSAQGNAMTLGLVYAHPDF